MRCAICNSILSAAEVQWNSDHKDWDPCNKCQEVIDGVFTDLTEEEIDEELAIELEDWEVARNVAPEETS